MKIIYLKNVQRQLRVSIYVTVTPRPNDRNILQHWPPSCEVLRHVARCWVCWLKFENGQIFHATFVDVS